MDAYILLSQFACRIGEQSIVTWKEGGGAGAFWICLTFAEFRVVYHQNCYPSPNVILLP